MTFIECRRTFGDGECPLGFPKLSKETALALQPDAIILSDSTDNQEPNEVFKDSPAVKNGRVYKINADIISRPGPRLIDALEQIAKDCIRRNFNSFSASQFTQDAPESLVMVWRIADAFARGRFDRRSNVRQPSRSSLGDLIGQQRSILFDIRLPRVFLAACVGASLAAAGAGCRPLLAKSACRAIFARRF